MMKYGLFVLASMSLPLLAYAHTTGSYVEKQVGEYILDIGYDPAQLIAGDRVIFDLGVLRADRSPIEYDNVWVRLVQGSTTLLATGIARQEYGPTTLLYRLPQESAEPLVANLRFELKDGTHLESSIELPVSALSGPFYTKTWVLCVAVAALGALAAAAAFSMARRRSATL